MAVSPYRKNTLHNGRKIKNESIIVCGIQIKGKFDTRVLNVKRKANNIKKYVKGNN